MDYGFAPGSTAQDKRARNLFSRRANTTLVAPKSLAVVRGFANFLLTSGTVTRPIDDALIAAHANSEGWILIPMFAKQKKGGTNFETLEQTLSDPTKSIAIDDRVIGFTTGDPIMHSVHFKGCNIGKAPPFLTKFREALGGNVMVTAPKHFHGIYEHTAYGTFEYMAYEFQVRNKTYFPNRTVLAAFDGVGFSYIDGTPVPTTDWPKWVPKKNVSKSVKTPVNPTLGVSIGKRKTIETSREYRVKQQKFQWSIKFSGGPPPSTTAAQQADFESSVSSDPKFQSTHDYPWYERLGYNDVTEFFAGYKWKHSAKKSTLYTTGTRVEYTILLPITDAAGDLVFNFHPLSTTPYVPITNLNETDSDFFEQV